MPVANNIIQLIDNYIELGGPGSGNWGHRGRKGKRGGSAPSGAYTSAKLLRRFMPQENIKDMGLTEDQSLSDVSLKRVMYNAKTQTMLASPRGSQDTHWAILAKYKGNDIAQQRFDDFIKFDFDEEGTVWADLRKAFSDKPQQWNAIFEAAKALRSAGVPGDTNMNIGSWMGGWTTEATMPLGEV